MADLTRERIAEIRTNVKAAEDGGDEAVHLAPGEWNALLAMASRCVSESTKASEEAMNDENPRSLGEALPAEMTRVRGLLPMYQAIGPAGAFALMFMNQALDRAQSALAEGDVVAMLHVYEELKGMHE
jgi:hypothetical protein